MLISRFAFATIFLVPCFAWNQADLQMFDLIDELKTNFYDFLGVDQTASTDSIRKAYRKLSLQYHPDRNPSDPTASDKFRQLVGVYDILKDPELRERYNDVLINGLPDWRNAVFYYRKLRKMSNAELFTLFAVLATTIHYLVLWGSWYERTWNMEEQLSTFYKRYKAKDKKREVIEMEIADRLRQVEKPKWHDILPFAICKALYHLVRWLPALFAFIKSKVCTQIDRIQEERIMKKEMAEEQLAKERLKAEKQERKRRLAQQQQDEISPYDPEILGGYLSISDIPSEAPTDASVEEKVDIGKEWSEDDIANLVRAVARFPGGVPERWMRIAEQLDRPMAQVLAKVKQLGEQGMNAVYQKTQMPYEIPTFEVNENAVCGEDSDEADNAASDSQYVEPSVSPQLTQGVRAAEMTSTGTASAEIETAVDEPYMSRKKQKKQQKEQATGKGREARTIIDLDDGWTQVEQKQLEVAIRSIDKSTPERWDRIAECVPTKTKAEVMQRVKHLSTIAKTRTHRG